MRLQSDPVHRFSHVSPIYNWIYPIAGARRSDQYSGDVAATVGPLQLPSEHARALYLHVPFCDTICTFCPLVKGPLEGAEALDLYVRAVLAEIALKGRDRELTRLPIRAVFFGGGTPSLLQTHHIEQIGQALHDNFDLGPLEEFSVEMEAKSINSDNAEAFRAIGVTHARFGVQTFVPRQRQAFNLTASIEQIRGAAALLKTVFPHVSCDLLYGLHGQTADELLFDVDEVTNLGLNNVDLYPLNIFVVQKKLHRRYRQSNSQAVSGLTKLYMTRIVRQIMRTKGYLPHNGHGYVKASSEELESNPVVTRAYAFKYHQHVYGACDDEFIGIGNSALSYIDGRTVTNELSRDRYAKDILSTGCIPVSVVEHGRQVNAAKIIAIGLPYLGHIKQSSVSWKDLPDITERRLAALVAHGLIEWDDFEIKLTHDGWLWYVNLMFYLAPREEQAAIAAIVMREGHAAFLPRDEIEHLTMTA